MSPKRSPKWSAQEKALLMARAALQKKPRDPVLLEVGESCSFADFFLILSGTSTRQTQALAGHLEETLRKQGIRPRGIEGMETGHWILMDYDEVIVHIFYESVREFYDLEGLWIEARHLPLFSDDSLPEVS
ncbi:MAG: ribosome silencing factor [Deltaproteobacteria bacterium RBG_13_43_22]|nr:MAG: ribosome silencing factor [Deltaproteobacteria bacterium RBG_13_43_22]